MPGDLAPPKAGAKGVAFDRLHTAPKADQIPEGLKTPKRQHSSRFDISEKRELEKLPGFHGMSLSRFYWRFVAIIYKVGAFVGLAF